MKNVASLNLSVNSFPLAWKIQINTSAACRTKPKTKKEHTIQEQHTYKQRRKHGVCLQHGLQGTGVCLQPGLQGTGEWTVCVYNIRGYSHIRLRMWLYNCFLFQPRRHPPARVAGGSSWNDPRGASARGGMDACDCGIGGKLRLG